jgi:low affinity Fe/Cu permease
MVSIRGKITATIALALVVMGVCALIIIFVLPLDKSEDELQLLVGAGSAVTIFTVFSVFAMIQENKKLKKTH